MVTLAWPPDVPWYIVLLSAAVVSGAGLLYMAVHRAYGRSDAPYDDAIPKPDGAGRAHGRPRSLTSPDADQNDY